MTARTVLMPRTLAVVPSGKVAEQLARQPPGARRGGVSEVIRDMTRLGQAGALPTRVNSDRRRLQVYTERHAVSLYLTSHGDAYRLGYLAPLTFHDQEQLSKGALLLHCPAGWHGYAQIEDVPQGMSAYWETIVQAWRTVAASRPAVTSPSPSTAYLDLLAEVVEAAQDIEIERQRTAPPVPYRRRRSAREERDSARGVYGFELLRPASLTAGTPVYLADDPELRGRVVRAYDAEITVRFDDAIDYRRIPAQGALQVRPSDRVHRAQLEAIDALRKGRVANPHLLSAMVDRRLQPFQPDNTATPRGSLDQGQLAAFRRALTVPDELLVLGPPGTGKTRTITEIIVAAAARGERVLVTSHTNRAVDNVLERLPSQVRAVRVGNEDAMTSHARGFRVESQVESLKQEILTATEGLVSRLGVLAEQDGPLPRWRDFLNSQVAEALAERAAAQAHAAALDTAVRRSDPVMAARLAASATAVDRSRAATQAAQVDLQSARERLAATQDRADAGALAILFRWLARRRGRAVSAFEDRLPPMEAALGEAESAHAQLLERAYEGVAAEPEIRAIITARDKALAAWQRAMSEAHRAAAMVQAGLQPVVPVTDDVPDDLDRLQRHSETLSQAVALAEHRSRLLREWRARVRDPGEELHRELVRYADLVAATCIGTSTTPLLADLDFDLAIVDEAGQISTPILLVPLIRAKRSVLVGDHHQLPPFLDADVEGWMNSLASSQGTSPETAREVGDLLRRSAFERLYVSADDGHRVMLTVQRRMPEPIARFVSESFYGDLLQTDHPGSHGDPVFRQPFAMVDTADRPASERAERPVQRNEEWGARGYVNELEAALITQLVAGCARWYSDWAVIVPYRAQARRVAELLTAALGDGAAVADSVGTVDSFQGGERDLIIYGFTRSNPRGDIGFLKELRRINVAITRARRQLVLVGDSTTLSEARDEAFAALFDSMTTHLRQSGDLRRSREVADQLTRLEGP
jgi:superfamily I DNA/RNA helicase